MDVKPCIHSLQGLKMATHQVHFILSIFGLMLVLVVLDGCTSTNQYTPEKERDQVPVGYGTQDAESIVSSVSSLEEEDIENLNISTVEQLLQGRVAGVHVITLPNGEFAVRIRGEHTFGASNEPLYVIDNVPVRLTSGGGVPVDPRDVARIEVLKGAGATAIYGSRGANGVILITTKRGRR